MSLPRCDDVGWIDLSLIHANWLIILSSLPFRVEIADFWSYRSLSSTGGEVGLKTFAKANWFLIYYLSCASWEFLLSPWP